MLTNRRTLTSRNRTNPRRVRAEIDFAFVVRECRRRKSVVVFDSKQNQESRASVAPLQGEMAVVYPFSSPSKTGKRKSDCSVLLQ